MVGEVKRVKTASSTCLLLGFAFGPLNVVPIKDQLNGVQKMDQSSKGSKKGPVKCSNKKVGVEWSSKNGPIKWGN